MKKKNINTYYSGNKNPENLIIRQIRIQAMAGKDGRQLPGIRKHYLMKGKVLKEMIQK